MLELEAKKKHNLLHLWTGDKKALQFNALQFKTFNAGAANRRKQNKKKQYNSDDKMQGAMMSLQTLNSSFNNKGKEFVCVLFPPQSHSAGSGQQQVFRAESVAWSDRKSSVIIKWVHSLFSQFYIAPGVRAECAPTRLEYYFRNISRGSVKLWIKIKMSWICQIEK